MCRARPFDVGVALLSVGVVATQTEAGVNFLNSLRGTTESMDHPIQATAVRRVFLWLSGYFFECLFAHLKH